MIPKPRINLPVYHGFAPHAHGRQDAVRRRTKAQGMTWRRPPPGKRSDRRLESGVRGLGRRAPGTPPDGVPDSIGAAAVGSKRAAADSPHA